jgi:hypothetical protein
MGLLAHHETGTSFRAMASVWPLFRDFAKYIGIAGDESTAMLTVKDVNGYIFTAEVPFVESLDDIEMISHEDLRFMASYPDKYYWFEYLPEESLMYVRFQRSREREDLSSAVFWQEIIDKIEGHAGVTTFVMDLRDNYGGIPLRGFYEFIWWAQIEENRAILGDVYIVIDNGGASAGTVYSFLLRNFVDDTTLIGSPRRGGASFFGGMNFRTMPNSGIDFTISMRSIILDPYSETNTLYPDIFVHRTLYNFVNNRDPVMEAIRARRETQAN